MTEGRVGNRVRTSCPPHLWLAGLLPVLWNAGSAWTITQTRTGAPMEMDTPEVAYFAAQDPWSAAVADLAARTALPLDDRVWLLLNCVTFVLAVLQWLYAWRCAAVGS